MSIDGRNDTNVIDFMERFDKKHEEKLNDFGENMAATYLHVLLCTIKLITGGDIDITNNNVLRNACLAFDIANEEFLANDELLAKYGGDENTPSIQLLLINKVINRAVEVFFGDCFQADKL